MRKFAPLGPPVVSALFVLACGVVELPFSAEDSRGSGGTVGDEETRDDEPHEDRTVGESPTEILRTTEISEPEAPSDERVSCGDTLVRDLYVPESAVEDEVKELVAQMSLDQKLLQLTGIPTPDYDDEARYEYASLSRDDPELGLRGYRWTDGPHGVNLALQYRHVRYKNYATSFPTSILQGATFDVDLARRLGEAMGDEAQASGATVLLAPTMNILRHPFWGRAQETFGEDSFHIGRMATGVVLGIQEHIAACAKHYAANNIEAARTKLNAEMDEQTLRETYGRHFEMVVRDAGVACMMAAHNAVNGTKSTQNQLLLSEMLRKDMGFRGFTVSDWWAMPSRNGNGQGPAGPPEDEATARASLLAGLDIEMPWTIHYDAIPRLIETKQLNVAVVDDAVSNVLEQKLRFRSAYLEEEAGLKPAATEYDETDGFLLSSDEHRNLAREVAEKGIVLLKNDGFDGGEPVLPIRHAKKVAVLGNQIRFKVKAGRGEVDVDFTFGLEAALGDRGSSEVKVDPKLVIGPFDGITSAAPEGIDVVWGGSSVENVDDVDVLVVVVGLTAGDEGEEFTGAADRDTLDLLEEHNQLITEAIALGKQVIVVVEGGGAVNMPWLDDVSAVVMAFYPGQQGGEALGRLLFGQANFSGKLPITWPRSQDQLPTFMDGLTTVMDYYVGYKRFDHEDLEPLFPFGYGLSYATFEYKNLSVPCATATKNAVIPVSVDVKNTSGVSGEEVAFVFASYPDSDARRPEKELKGFARVHLEAGETKRVTVPIRVEDLKYWDMEKSAWVVEEGRVEFRAGPRADTLPLQATVEIGSAN